MSDIILATANLYEESKYMISEIMGNQFPWYWASESVDAYQPFFSHVVMARGENGEDGRVNSSMYEPIVNLLKIFSLKTGVEIKKIHRICLNSVWNYGIPMTGCHVDYPYPHKIFIMYLTANNGDTVLFDKKYEGGDQADFIIDPEEIAKLPIKERVTPEVGKAFVFDGLYFHAFVPPTDIDRRVVCVVGFE